METTTQTTKTKESVNKKRVLFFLIIPLAVIGVIAAFVHKSFEFDSHLNELQSDYKIALAKRNELAKEYKSTIDAWAQGQISTAQLESKKEVFIQYNVLEKKRKLAKAPFIKYKNEKKIKGWDNLSTFLFFIGWPIFGFIGIGLFLFKIIYKLNDNFSDKIYKMIGVVYLAVPGFFIFHAILHGSDLVSDFSPLKYNIMTVSLGLATGTLVYYMLNGMFNKWDSEIEFYNKSLKKLFNLIYSETEDEKYISQEKDIKYRKRRLEITQEILDEHDKIS